MEFLPRRSHGATPPRSAFPTTKAVGKVSAVVLGKGSRAVHKRGTSFRRALEGDQTAPLDSLNQTVPSPKLWSGALTIIEIWQEVSFKEIMVS